MKTKLVLLLSLTLLAATACKKTGPSQSPEAMAKEFSNSMCSKMTECMNEQLAKMPANVREMAKGQMMDEAKCREMAKNPSGKPHGDDMWKKLTDGERSVAMGCMKAMPQASCESIMKNSVPECREWQKIMQGKQG